MRVVHRIRVPALVITAADDPFVPAAPFRSPELAQNPIRARARHAARRALRFPGADSGGVGTGYWAERQIVEFRGERGPGGAPLL